MATTPKEFISKNLKWITLGLLLLFMFKFIQSCNRGTEIGIQKANYEIKVDSLTREAKIYVDSVKQLNFELKIANNKALSADEKAAAVQSAVEKLKSNTTITVKGADKN